MPTIIGEIKRVFRDTGAIKVSRSLKELSFKVAKTREQLEKQMGREPSISEVAESLGADEEDVKDALCILQPISSLTYTDDDGNKQIELPVESEEKNIDNKVYIESLLNTLSKTDRELIILRYFHYKTQSETASIMNMSQVQVSRAEKRILTELRGCRDG